MRRTTYELEFEGSTGTRFDLFVGDEPFGFGDYSPDAERVDLRADEHDLQVTCANMGLGDYHVHQDGEVDGIVHVRRFGGGALVQTSWRDLQVRRRLLALGSYDVLEGGRRVGWLRAPKLTSADHRLVLDDTVERPVAAIVLAVFALHRRRWLRQVVGAALG